MSIDSLHRYLFDNADVRGELVQLDQTYQQIITSHNYPNVLKHLLGELMVASSLLTATLKFKGDIAVQLQGDGPVSLAVINGNDQQQLRGVARWKGELSDDASLAELFGKGYLVITLTPEEGERYQGVVALDKPDLASCIEAYFMQSEQLLTRIWLFTSDEKAAGIFLQVLPSDKDHLDDFDHLTQLTSTTKADEIFNLPAEELLHRLYHEEQVRLFDPVEVSFKCSCSRERTSAAILTLPKEEVTSILEEQNAVELDCEYCNTHYRFDSIDIAAIYARSNINETQQ